MMLLRSPFLPPDDVERLRREADGLAFRDGRASAGAFARRVKTNLQADPAAAKGVADFVVARLRTDPVVQAAAWPRQIGAVMITRSDPGMGYGPHVDNALLGEGAARLRGDLAFTLFLSEPDAYDGGDLVIMAADGERRFKPPAGGLVLYPASTVHRVETVTRGLRLAVVGWIESSVRAQYQRDILFDLANLRSDLTDPAQVLILDKAIGNLLRAWAQA
jgi:PKHD-type hydroxylase